MNEPAERTAPRAPTDGAKPTALLALILAGALGLASMVGGVYAIFVGTTADTTLGVLGAHVNAASVGVALVAVGFIAEVVVFRELLQHLERVAAPPR